MVVCQFKCGMCNHRFEAEVLDRDDPKERHRPGSRLLCPRCHSAVVETLRVIRRVFCRVA